MCHDSVHDRYHSKTVGVPAYTMSHNRRNNTKRDQRSRGKMLYIMHKQAMMRKIMMHKPKCDPGVCKQSDVWIMSFWRFVKIVPGCRTLEPTSQLLPGLFGYVSRHPTLFHMCYNIYYFVYVYDLYQCDGTILRIA